MSHPSIKCVIIDDEEMATKVIASHLSQIPDFEVVGIYHSAVEAFLQLEQQPIDVMFLDIQMPKITGMSLLQMLKKPPLTIMTTAHRDYALESYDLEVVDYLLKPISLQRFLKSISKVKKLLQPSSPNMELQEERSLVAAQATTRGTAETKNIPADHLFVKSNRMHHKVALKDILYIEAIKNHIKVVAKHESLIALIPISDFQAKLPQADFLRVHRSYIVSLSQINKFDSYALHIGNKTIPIGRSYQKEVKEVLGRKLI